MFGFLIVPWLMSLALAAPTPAASEAPGYVRFCTYAESATGAQIEARNDEERTQFPDQDPDAKLIALATHAIGASDPDSIVDIKSISISVRDFGVVTGHGPSRPDEAILFRIERTGSVTHFLVTFDSTGHPKSVRSATQTEVDTVLDFGRAMGTYILFNDLTASDAEIPRKGCESAFREQFNSLPELLPEVMDAARVEPVQDHALLGIVRKALDVYIATADKATGQEGAITRQTLKSIGSSPTITVVYRDQNRSAGSKMEFDVVRLGGNKRAYAMFGIDKAGNATLGPMPICLVGDTSCAGYYAWP